MKKINIVLIYIIHYFAGEKLYIICNYLNPIAACHTKASSKKNTGITGKISTNGRNIAYASGNFATINVSSIKLYLKKYSKVLLLLI